LLSHESTDEHLEVSIDLSECYPPIASCGDLVRSFYLDKTSGRLRVKEYYELGTEHSYETAVVTEGEVEQTDTHWTIQDGSVLLNLRPFEDTDVLTVEELEYRDASGQLRKLHRIVMVPARLGEQKFIGYELEIASAD
jgi:hypothetical protein